MSKGQLKCDEEKEEGEEATDCSPRVSPNDSARVIAQRIFSHLSLSLSLS